MQSIFGILGGQGPDAENLVHAKRIADKLFGDQYQWSVMASGRHQLPFVTMAAICGGNVRVGLEDLALRRKGQACPVERRAGHNHSRILEALSLDVATPQEARAMLGLKGADSVRFLTPGWQEYLRAPQSLLMVINLPAHQRARLRGE